MNAQSLRSRLLFVGSALLSGLLLTTLLPLRSGATPLRVSVVTPIPERAAHLEDLMMRTVLLQPVCRYFANINQTVCDPFWSRWVSQRTFEDSVDLVGYPITPVGCERSANDKPYWTQWFERARLELHPENQPPFDVLLGLLGVSAVQGRQNEAPFRLVQDPGSSLEWFKETGHTLGDSSEGGRAIASFWHRQGGLPQFGFPLSQPFMERSRDNGQMYLVQYFERQRLEYHPENNGGRYEVLLGRLGAEQYKGAVGDSNCPGIPPRSQLPTGSGQ